MQTGQLIVLGSHEHVHADGTRHSHPPHRLHPGSHHLHDHTHDHSHDHGSSTVVEIETRILAKNDALASANRHWFSSRKVLSINLMSSPGAGKTTLLERTIRDLGNRTPLLVVEGDQATSNDGERIRAAGAPVVQVNTGTGCHLDAQMVARGVEELNPPAGSILMIENVGNLVCPALFDLGEHRKVAILSVTEGDDKPVKYPHMFRAADLILINKIDLLPYVDFDLSRALAQVRAVNADASVLYTSSRTGEGLDEWYRWLESQRQALTTSDAN
ncbi:hydrogenase nickel incorporation protein HypB [Steroidobacter gossypii]|nr:hydrogenase nickel incorporation protein HypB [Steroidobacter gossypii]